MRQVRHCPELDGPACTGASSVSPQRTHRFPLRAGNFVQQTSQTGTELRCGREEPQRAQEEGRRAQLKESTGLRSTRTTARQREGPEGGTSHVSEPESLRKTHLTSGRQGSTPAALPSVYLHQALDSMLFAPGLNRNSGILPV